MRYKFKYMYIDRKRPRGRPRRRWLDVVEKYLAIMERIIPRSRKIEKSTINNNPQNHKYL